MKCSLQFSYSVLFTFLQSQELPTRQASLSITNSQTLPKLMSIQSVMPSNHPILFHPLLLPPAIFPASWSFPISQFFALGGQSIGVSASTSVLPMNTWDWSPLGWVGWISLALPFLWDWDENWLFPVLWPLLSFPNVPLVSLVSLKRSLVFPILLFSSISLHWPLRNSFLSLLDVLWNSTFRWIIFPFLLCLSLHFFSQLFVRLPQAAILPFCIFSPRGWFWSPPPVQVTYLRLQALSGLIPWIYTFNRFSQSFLCSFQNN